MRPAALISVAFLLAAGGGCFGGGSSVEDVKQGMTKERVRDLAGKPDRAGPRCWIYRPSTPDADDGRRLCFTNGRVSLVQFIVHGSMAASAAVLDDYAADGRLDLAPPRSALAS